MLSSIANRQRMAVAALVTLALCGSLAALAGPPSDAPAAVQTRAELKPLLAKLSRNTTVGLLVVDVDGGDVWFANDPATPLKPASVLKLFVTAAALERFGPDFQYRTRLYAVNDELWVVGAGDPALGDDRLAELRGRDINYAFDDWASAMRNRGITTLNKVVLDDSIFEDRGRHPDWPDDQADRWYQAPVGAFSYNDNCLDVRLVVHDGNVDLVLQPDVPASLIHSTLTVGTKHRPVIRRDSDSDVFELSGTVTRGGDLTSVAVGRPTVFFGYALHRALKERGIAMRGPVVRRQLSEAELNAAPLLAEHVTRLRDIVARCNTYSQNLFAECLLKSLAAYRPDGQRSGTPGSWEAGRAVLEKTLDDLGVDVSTATFRDGSGLSHSNRVTAQQIVDLLLTMRRHKYADVFIDSLAEPGQPGSVRTRYDDPALRGRLRAKTGTIDGVRALAGYLTRPDGTTLAFALLINGSAPSDLPLKICKSLAD